MYKEITLNSAEGTPISVPFMANAATAYRFKALFNKDLLLTFQSAKQGDLYNVEFIEQLAFLMAMQAKAKNDEIDLTKINEESMVLWLERFDGMELLNHAGDIMDVYLGNTRFSSKEKKRAIKQTEN
jgi:hypothetical protein